MLFPGEISCHNSEKRQVLGIFSPKYLWTLNRKFSRVVVYLGFGDEKYK